MNTPKPSKREGPRTYTRTICTGCTHLGIYPGSRIAMGVGYYCGHPNAPKRPHIGSVANTPEFCPVKCMEPDTVNDTPSLLMVQRTSDNAWLHHGDKWGWNNNVSYAHRFDDLDEVEEQIAVLKICETDLVVHRFRSVAHAYYKFSPAIHSGLEFINTGR